VEALPEQDAANRIEAAIRRERRPLRLSELRKLLGLDRSESGRLLRILREDGRFYRVGSSWHARGAPLKITVRFCPNCGWKAVKYGGGFYRCPNCQIRFHFTWLA